ncbi:efflux RND transporter periplasmic adaptor subunit [Inhella sp.]|uniref:efflux RND transporter periplasmic adaptor subunit n=1 Tax=Inhella sp. TaxID=1921806 RepID=UPI0035B4A954
MKHKRPWWIYLIAALVLVAGAIAVSRWLNAKAAASRPAEPWLTQTLDRGSLRRTISATGTVTPVNLIQVGTQVSGTIARLHVDYNAVVRAGALLAEIDTAVLDAEVAQAQAQRAGAQAAFDLARSQAARQESLFSQGFVSRADVDQAVTTAKNAQAALDQQEAALQRATLGRDRATIRSPVAGTVISREVSVGQTVAASLQTPVLFKIAQDLREMQIDASVAEADVGLMREGQPVRFTVDAFPDRVFDGQVRQIRNNHQVQQNVVTYTAVIAARNDELLLRPGMTAYVAVTVGERQEVTRIPNAALRYAPAAAASAPVARTDRAANQRTVWRWDGVTEPQPIEVTLGLSDGRWTELMAGALKPGDRLVVGERKASVSFGPKIF